MLYGGFPYPGPNKRQLFHLVREGGARVYEKLNEVICQFFCDGVVDIEHPYSNSEIVYDWQHTSTLFLVIVLAFYF